jgi:hypothetical protein
MNYSRLALAGVGARLALTLGQAIAYFAEWTVVGIVIGLIYRAP